MRYLLTILAAILMATLRLTAQDLIIPRQGAPITAYNVDASKTFIYYTITNDTNAKLLRIPKDSVLMVRKADGTAVEINISQPIKQANKNPQKDSNNYPIIDEASIHGNLIAKGNRVFIPTDSQTEAELAGQIQFREKVREWGYWTVVDSPEQGHFVLQYILDSEGKDYSILLLRPREYYKKRPSIDFKLGNVGLAIAKCKSNDSDSRKSIEDATMLFNHLKKMITDPDYDKKVEKYSRFIYNDDYDYSQSPSEHFYHYIKYMKAESTKKDITHSRISIPTLY